MVSTSATASLLSKGRFCAFLFLTILGTGVSTPSFGNSVAEVTSSSFKKDETSNLAKELGIEIGKALDLERLNDSVKALSGKYQTLKIESEAKNRGLVIHLNGIVSRRVREFKFHNVDSDVLAEVKSRAPLTEGEVADPRVLQFYREALTAAYQDRGYYFAEVIVTTEEVEDGREVDVKITVVPKEPTVVTKVSLQGVERGQEILNQSILRKGDRFARLALDKSVENILKYLRNNQYPTSKVDETIVNFSEDKLKVELTFVVRLGNRYQFELIGNSIYSDVTLRELITEEILSQADPAQKVAGLILDKYRAAGFHFCIVTPETLIRDRDNMHVIRFRIEEGARVIIDDIDFTTEQSLSRGELESLMIEEAPGVIKRKIYWEAGVPEMLVRFLKKVERIGFQKPSINGPRTVFSEDKKGVRLIFDLELGIQSFVSKVQFQGNKAVSEDEALGALPYQKGDPYSKEKVEEGKTRLTDLYRKKGYADAKVQTGATKTAFFSAEEQKNAEVTYIVEEGPKYFVGEISVDGNQKTASKVILREMLLKTGDVYDPFKLRQSEENIYLLGLFGRVEILSTPSPADPHVKDIRVIVVELRPGAGEVGFGGAYSDPRIRARGFFSMNYKNIAGTNQTVSSRAEVAVPFSFKGNKPIPFIEYGVTLGYRAPYPFDVPVIFGTQAGLDGYETVTNADGTLSTLQYRARIEERVEKRLSSRVTFLYRLHHYERTTTEELSFDPTKAATKGAQRDNIGSTGPGLIVDFRDDIFNPTLGSYHTLDVEFAHPALLSDPDVFFAMAIARNSLYLPVADPFSLQFFAGAGVAKALDSNPTIRSIPTARLTNELALGGQGSIRGFSSKKFQADAGASDAAYYVGRAELNVKLWSVIENLSLAVFFDAGQVFSALPEKAWVTKPRHEGYGVGFRYKTPVGPLVVDFAQGLGDDKENVKFSLTVGTF